MAPWLFIVVGFLVLFGVAAGASADSATGDTMTYPLLPVGVSLGIRALARAIADAEGFGVAGAIPTRANNPGDLVRGDLGHGVLGAQAITVYATAADGWAALTHQLQLIADGRSANFYPSMTLADMGGTWAGPGAGAEWASNVSASLNRYGYPVTPDSMLTDVVYS